MPKEESSTNPVNSENTNMTGAVTSTGEMVARHGQDDAQSSATAWESAACPICGAASCSQELRQALWLAPDLLESMASRHPAWKKADGACPACVQQLLLQALLGRGDTALHEAIQNVWPLDAEAAFGVLPTPLRMHADPRFTGRGVTVALVDAAFYPHPDLIHPANRIRAWVDAASDPVIARRFGREETPAWPGWDARAPAQWHGMMTSTAMAGNGWLSHGLYRGLACDSDLVLLQVRDHSGHISSESISRALRWIVAKAAELRVRLASLSVAGDPMTAVAGNPVDAAVRDLVAGGITVVAASGNAGERRLIPPATAPEAITVGGLDDRNTVDHSQMILWHSNYGVSDDGALKPELVAPSLWVVAPVLPGSEVAIEAEKLFAARAAGDTAVEKRIAEQKLITPYYQHVEGTSFAAPLLASVIACMLEANPSLTPRMIRNLLAAAAHPVAGAPAERQGAGAVDAGQAVALALRARGGPMEAIPISPQVTPAGISFFLHDRFARQVQVLGSWDHWSAPGLIASRLAPGVWQAWRNPLPAGRYEYKFVLDGTYWLDDPANPHKVHNGAGAFNSVLLIPTAPDRPS